MKTIIILFIGILIYSCGENPVTDNPTNSTADTVVLFTKDSIFTGSPYAGRDSVDFISSISVDTLHVEFIFTSQNVLGCLVRSYTFDTAYTSLPSVYSKEYHLKFAINNTFTCKNYIELMGATGSSYYASLRNIKLWYIK